MRNDVLGVDSLAWGKKYGHIVGETGDVELVTELMNIEPRRGELLEPLLQGVARAGHDELTLRVLSNIKKLPNYDDLCIFTIRVVEAVALGGCVRTAASMDIPEPRNWVPHFRSTLKKGHQPFIEWFLADVEPDANAYYVEYASKSGSLELVKWLYAKGYPVRGKAMRNAASSGNVALCKWVSGHGIGPTQSAMEEAVKRGHVEVLEWLSTQGCSCTSELLRYAVRKGGVPVISWCLDHLPQPIDFSDLLVLSCRNKRSDVLEYLLDERGFQCSPTELMNAAADHMFYNVRASFDAAILVKRYDIPLYRHYLSDAIYYDDLDRLRFALSQGQKVTKDCYTLLMTKADPTLLNEVLLAKKVVDSIPEADQELIKETLQYYRCHPNAKKVLADHSVVV
jgi:hypothetical protein